MLPGPEQGEDGAGGGGIGGECEAEGAMGRGVQV